MVTFGAITAAGASGLRRLSIVDRLNIALNLLLIRVTAPRHSARR
jgi:hypothetical protein